jgi:glycosyltransferase involved in cell wall biosynthesis
MNLITIAITCFREGELLTKCWESIVSQTNKNWEAIMVLDHGYDQLTFDRFNKINHQSLRKYINTSNLGPYLSRNKAFEFTETEYHYYVDGDDYLSPDAVSEFYKTYNNCPDADIYYTDLYAFHSEAEKKIIRSVDIINENSLTCGFALYGANIIKKEIWHNVKGFKAKYNWTLGDLDFYFSCFEAGASFCHINKPLYNYRRSEQSVSEKYTTQYHRIYEQLVEDHHVLFQKDFLRNSFLSNGYLASASAEYSNYDYKIASALISRAIVLNDTIEARSLETKINRDRQWPFWLLKTFRSLKNIMRKYYLINV